LENHGTPGCITRMGWDRNGRYGVAEVRPDGWARSQS
jgi:hypothetical protein